MSAAGTTAGGGEGDVKWRCLRTGALGGTRASRLWAAPPGATGAGILRALFAKEALKLADDATKSVATILALVFLAKATEALALEAT